MKQTPPNRIVNTDLLALMPHNCRRIIEIGCMHGALAQAYRQQNPEAEYVGVDIDSKYAKIAESFCSQTIAGNIELLPTEVFESFFPSDCWVFGDCLEHLYDPWKLLEQIRNRIDSDGCLVTCIPNAQHWSVQMRLASGKFFYEEHGLMDRTHIRWFTRETILKMFQDAGWVVENIFRRILAISLPQQEQHMRAITAMAEIAGLDPELAIQDATTFQYLLKVKVA